MAEFIIPGEPVGKARARVTRWGTYTPEKTKKYEELIRVVAKQASDFFYVDAPLLIVVKAYYAIPKSANKASRYEMLTGLKRPTKKPDVDNVLKSVCDALNGVYYKDDSQIVAAYVFKYYDAEPRVEVKIEAVTQYDYSN